MVIVDKINEWATKTPHKTAILHDGNDISYIRFAKCIELTRLHLLRQSIPFGTTVVVSISNLCDAWVAVLAARANGLRTVFTPSVESISTLDLDNISQIITTEIEAKEIEFTAKTLENVGITKIAPDLYSLGQIESISLFSPSHPQPGDHILFSSGTSGKPKKLIITSKMDYSICCEYSSIYNEYIEFFDVSEKKEVNLFNLSISSVSCYRRALLAWYKNGTVIFDQNENIKSLGRRSRSLLVIKPSIAKEICNIASTRKHFNQNLVAEVSGGSINADVANKLKEFLTPHVFFVYGATEVLYAIFATKIQHEEDLLWQRKVPSRIVEIVDPSGAVCAPNCEGEIRVKLMEYDHTHYLNDPEASSKAFREGFFYPGDMAVQREDGRIRILGRVTDVLIMNGNKYAVAPIESDLCVRLKVRDLCLFARQNAQTEEELFVVMECNGLPSSEELQAVNRDFEVFQKVHFWPFHSFPRNAGGKTDRRTLQQFVYAEADKVFS